MVAPPPLSTPFPYTTLFRSLSSASPSRRRRDRPRRRTPSLHRLAETDPDRQRRVPGLQPGGDAAGVGRGRAIAIASRRRSEEHTSELQSPDHLVFRLLLEKK